MLRVMIAVPTFENIQPATFKSIYDLEIPENVEATFEYVTGYDCARARNAIVDKAIKNEFDYVFMVDSDVVLLKYALSYLLEDEPNMVMGAYPRKNEPSKSEVFDVRHEHFDSRFTIAELRNFPGNRLKIKGGGFGCALVKIDIFKEVGYPYFNYVIYKDRAFLSEDLYFCDKVNKLGYGIYVDTRVICKHIGKTMV